MELKYAEKNSNHKAAEKFNVVKRIRKWRQNKLKVKVEPKTVKPKNKRLEGGGRKPPDLQFVNQLVEWIYDRRSNGLSVSRKLIMSKAKYFYESECDESEKSFFVASIIMRCNSFSLRRKTTTMAKQYPEQLIDKLILYILPAVGFQLNVNTLFQV